MSFVNKLTKKISRTIEILKKSGSGGVRKHLIHLYKNHRREKIYGKLRSDYLTDSERKKISHEIEKLAYQPLISVLMPVYDVEEKWLRAALESVVVQVYQNWELCIADDNSPSKHVRRVLEEYAARDSRIKVVFREENGHISAASNSALEITTGAFVALLDHDDEITPDALFYVVKELNDFPQADLIYSDEDMFDETNRRYNLKFKPDWSPELFYSINLLTHLIVYRTEVLKRVGGFRIGMEGSQDYDLALRVIEQIPSENIRHISRILYHWRAIPGSVALAPEEKMYAHGRARQAISEHFERRGIAAKAIESDFFAHRVIHEIPKNTSVSVILTHHEDSQINRILQTFSGDNFELIALVDKSANKPPVRLVERQKTVAASLNEAARKATGDVLIFLDKSVEPTEKDAFRELVGYALQEGVGAVGGKILNDDDTVRNAGIVLGIGENKIGFAHRDFSENAWGYFLRAVVANNFSAVCGAFAVRREIFGDGFDGANFPNGLFEIDLCLRLIKKGYRNVFTPYAKFIQTAESPTENVLRGNLPELIRFKNKWKSALEKDAYYNPNLSTVNQMLLFEPR